MDDEILKLVKECCLSEIEINNDDDLQVTDGTEDINEGRAEFAVQILRLIAMEQEANSKWGTNSLEYKAMMAANNARTEESATKNSNWAPGALGRAITVEPVDPIRYPPLGAMSPFDPPTDK